MYHIRGGAKGKGKANDNAMQPKLFVMLAEPFDLQCMTSKTYHQHGHHHHHHLCYNSHFPGDAELADFLWFSSSCCSGTESLDISEKGFYRSDAFPISQLK